MTVHASSTVSLVRSAGLILLGGVIGGGLVYASQNLPFPASGAGKSAMAPQADMASEASVVIARVNGETITKSDFDTIVGLLPDALKTLPQDQIFPLLQEQMVTSLLIEQTATQNGVDQTPLYQSRVREAEKQVLRQLYLDDVVAASVNETALKAAYDQMIAATPAEDEVHARHILVDTPEKAADIIDQLKGGADFAKLATEHSKDSSAMGGDLGYFTQGMMVKPFADSAFAMDKGAISTAPVKTEFGYHVIQVLDRRPRPLPTFDEARPQIEADLRRKAVDGALQTLRDAAQVELFDLTGAPMTVQNKVDAALGTSPDVPQDVTVDAAVPADETAPASPETLNAEGAAVDIVPSSAPTEPSPVQEHTAPQSGEATPAEPPVVMPAPSPATPPTELPADPTTTIPATP